jgi:hypothetical protein
MIRSAESLSLFIDLISDGVSVSEATTAIGGSPHSKIAFLWLKESESEEAANFEAPPDVSSSYCIMRDGTPRWLHHAYAEAVIAGRVARTIRRTPIRADLEAKLRAKRMGPPKQPGYLPPRVQVFKPSDEPANPVTRDLPAPPPRPRPSYAYKSRPLDASNTELPQEGRFLMTGDRPKTKGERRAGTVEITDLGIRRW